MCSRVGRWVATSASDVDQVTSGQSSAILARRRFGRFARAPSRTPYVTEWTQVISVGHQKRRRG